MDRTGSEISLRKLVLIALVLAAGVAAWQIYWNHQTAVDRSRANQTTITEISAAVPGIMEVVLEELKPEVRYIVKEIRKGQGRAERTLERVSGRYAKALGRYR